MITTKDLHAYNQMLHVLRRLDRRWSGVNVEVNAYEVLDYPKNQVTWKSLVKDAIKAANAAKKER